MDGVHSSRSSRRRRSRSPSHRRRSLSRDNERSSRQPSGPMQRMSATLLGSASSGNRPHYSSSSRSNESGNRRRDHLRRLEESSDETGSRGGRANDNEDNSSADERGNLAPTRSHRDDRRTSARDTASQNPYESLQTNIPEMNRFQESSFLRAGSLPSQADSFPHTPPSRHRVISNQAAKETPNFLNTGRLAAATNTVELSDGTIVVLKYHEPQEARKPLASDMWRLVIFKSETDLDGHSGDITTTARQSPSEMVTSIDLTLRSCWLIGRETSIADLPAGHMSVSGQHAVIQFRDITGSRDGGSSKVRPYLIDLQSVNGTQVNGKEMPDSRYIEIRHGDVITVGYSSREYVLVRAQPNGELQ